MGKSTEIPTTGFVRLNTVLAHIPVSKSTWYAGVAEGRYPRPIQLGPRTAAYRAEDIIELIKYLGLQSREQQEV